MEENSEGQRSEWGEGPGLCPKELQQVKEEVGELQTEGGVPDIQETEAENHVTKEEKASPAVTKSAEKLRTCGGKHEHCVGQALCDLPKKSVGWGWSDGS